MSGQAEETPPDVKVPGLEPVFRHLDDPDVPWQQVKAIRNADGTTSSVWEKWLSFSPDPQYLSLYARYDPGMIVRRHGHYSPHVLFVLEGEIRCGDRNCPAGTHIELPLGAAFGPFVAGPDGAVLFEVMMGDPRSWGDDRAAFLRALEEHGATELPDPPLEFPAWLRDLRSAWAGADGANGSGGAGGAGPRGGPTHEVVRVMPVGRVVGGRTTPTDDHWASVEARIVLDAERFDDSSVAGLGDFSHLDVVFVFDRASDDNVVRGARHPRGREDWPLVGIFAQRGKDRPNHLGVSTCELLSVSGTELLVRGLDAIDGTPVLDVKPHVAAMGPRGAVREAAWMGEVMAEYW